MAKKVKSNDPDKKSAWRKYPADLVMRVWLLVTGGIDKPRDINKILGTSLHAWTIDSMVKGGDRLRFGPLPLERPVRCRGCGIACTEIPCAHCGTVPGFTVIKRNRRDAV
jgi:hypothetical protein